LTLTALIGPLLYRSFAMVVELLVRRGQPRRMLEAEVVALRHQVKVLRRQVSRVEFTETDRAVRRAGPGTATGSTGRVRRYPGDPAQVASASSGPTMGLPAAPA